MLDFLILNSINMAPKKIGLELWLLLVRNRKFFRIKGYPIGRINGYPLIRMDQSLAWGFSLFFTRGD